MWIVDVKLNGVEKVLDSRCLRCVPIDHVLRATADHHLDQIMPLANLRTEQLYLSSDGDLVKLVVSNRTLFFIRVVEDEGYTCFGDTGLSLFVHELL